MVLTPGTYRFRVDFSNFMGATGYALYPTGASTFTVFSVLYGPQVVIN